MPETYGQEGQLGTSDTNPSGYFSNSPSRASGRRTNDGRRASEHRISTVEEADEEYHSGGHHSGPHSGQHLDDEPDNFDEQSYGDQYDHGYDDAPLTPTQERNRDLDVHTARIYTPPQDRVAAAGGFQSHENTPSTPKTEKSKKHKSNSSSILPRISRWSKTTASSVAQEFRSSGRKEKKDRESHDYADPASRSGSQVGYYGEDGEPYYADKLHTGQSEEQFGSRGSPMIPHDQLMALDDLPKHQANRISLDIQHPQPRAGPPGGRFQHLENQANLLNPHGGVPQSPISPQSDHFGSTGSLGRYAPNANRNSGGPGNLSPISDDGLSHRSAGIEDRGSPAPPAEALTPQRPAKLRKNRDKQYGSPLATGLLAPSDERRYSNSSAPTGESPRSLRSTSNMGSVVQRKPTGPRPLSSASNGQNRISSGSAGNAAAYARASPGDEGLERDGTVIKRKAVRGSRDTTGKYLIESNI
jgi:hypothetical protein